MTDQPATRKPLLDQRLQRLWRGICQSHEDRVVFVEAGREWSPEQAIERMRQVIAAVYPGTTSGGVQPEFYNVNHASVLLDDAGTTPEGDQVRAMLEIGWDGNGPIYVLDPLVACRANLSRLLTETLRSIHAEREGVARNDAPDQQSGLHHTTLDNMERHGGGFVQALAIAWRKADPQNHARLYSQFSDYYRQYQLADL